ncbi:chemotaxis protein CheD [Vibrio sp. AK197]
MMHAVQEHIMHQNNPHHFSRFQHPVKDVTMVKLQPGGIYCTEQAEIICTGLGSCVSACIWDDEIALGGMNHFLLPFDNINQQLHWHPDQAATVPSRYGAHAMEMLINYLIAKGASRQRLQVKLFGGAEMMGRYSKIGEKNVEFILDYVERESLNVVSQDLGGLDPRKIMFDPTSGRAWLKRIPFSEVHLIKQQELHYASELERQAQLPTDNVELF